MFEAASNCVTVASQRDGCVARPPRPPQPSGSFGHRADIAHEHSLPPRPRPDRRQDDSLQYTAGLQAGPLGISAHHIAPPWRRAAAGTAQQQERAPGESAMPSGRGGAGHKRAPSGGAGGGRSRSGDAFTPVKRLKVCTALGGVTGRSPCYSTRQDTPV